MIKIIRIVLLAALLGALGNPAAMNAAAKTQATAPHAALAASGLAYQWHTFYGVAESLGQSRSVAVDSAGNVYIAGYANKTWGSPLHAYSGDYDILVMKLNNQGKYLWHTYYGASHDSSLDGDDEGNSIAVDGSGNVYVTGYSDRNWLGADNTAPLNAHGGDAEYMFVLKLNSSGAYQWHTFYQPGRANALAVDGSSNVYITGYASATWGSPLHTADGNLVVLKLNGSGAYQWHTYYGAGASAADEAGYGIATTPDGSAVYVTGSAPDTWQGDGDTDPKHDFSGGAGYSTDILALKLSSSGGYLWHTFYGASETDDFGYGVAVDSSGAPYMAGYSYASWGSPLHAYNDEGDIAALSLNSAGEYQWHTFYGSGGHDSGAAIALHGDNLYIAGGSADAWLGDANASPAHPHSGGSMEDITVLKLSTSGAYQRHTFYGAVGAEDHGLGIAANSSYEVFVTGYSISTWLGDGAAGPLHAHSSNLEGDDFVLKLSDRVYDLFLPRIVK